MNLLRRVGVTGFAVSLVVAGCGRSPTNPAPVDPTVSILKPGLHLLHLLSFDFSSDPGEACEQPGVPREGKNVNAFVMLQRVGDHWSATLAPNQSGGATLTFRYSGQRVSSGYQVTGTISGEMHDTAVGTSWPGTGVRVHIGGSGGSDAALVEGIVSESSVPISFTYGRIIGRFTYTNSSGDAGNCPAASWSLQSYRGT